MESEIQNPQKLLSTTEAAAMLGVSPGTLEVWRSTKRWQLRYFKIGVLVRYRVSDVNEFIASGAKGERKQFTPRKKAKGRAA